MTQLTIRTQVPAPARRRTARTARMVGLRSAMPLGLVTLRHDVPEFEPDDLKETTPKVGVATLTQGADVETAAGKGGGAQW
jgi:hypothetical protein